MIRRRAFTLVEVVVLLGVMAIVLSLAIPRAGAARDRAAVQAAARDVRTLFAEARAQALARNVIVWVVLDSVRASVVVTVPGTAARVRTLGALYGIRLRATRDSMSYDGRGLGRGAANLSVVLTRGKARASVVVSRLGRVRP